MIVITSGVGYLGKAAETRYTKKGESVTGFSLAMDSGFGDNKQTLWSDCSGWGSRYEAVAPHLTKGARVFVSGEQGEREYDGKVYKTLRLTALQLVGDKKEGNEQPPTGNTSSGRRKAPTPAPARSDGPFPDNEVIDDIPFITNIGKF